ncbi:MAG: DUF2726 domain-containing protein [Methylococcaceae bacterium]|nr:DUF2726 domain-containing protein [Methylococcaceae bacterium]
MTWLTIVGLALTIVGVTVLIALPFLIRRFSGPSGRKPRHPYQKQTALFTPDERVFFRALKEAVGEEYEIFGKLPVVDIVHSKMGASRHALDPLAGRHFDFVLCERDTLTVTCAILLHDKTSPARQIEPDPLQPICENLGLPLRRFQIQAAYSAEEIREKLHQALIKEPFYLVETDGRKEPRISSLEDIEL